MQLHVYLCIYTFNKLFLCGLMLHPQISKNHKIKTLFHNEKALFRVVDQDCQWYSQNVHAIAVVLENSERGEC